VAETLTPNYGWTKPDPGASANTWGSTLNATTDKVDAQVKVNELAITAGQSPVGSITMFGGATPPSNWYLCDGASLSTAAPNDKLFAVIGYAFGGSGANFNLPNLKDIFPIGASATRALAANGGLATVTLDATMIPAHAHPITDVAHTHTATQPAHTHADAGHGHAATGSQDAHSHTVTGNPGGGFGASAPPSPIVNQGQLTTSAAQPSVYVSVAAGYANLAAAQPAITVASHMTGITTTQNTGGGAAHNNMPPWLALNFIIRFA